MVWARRIWSSAGARVPVFVLGIDAINISCHIPALCRGRDRTRQRWCQPNQEESVRVSPHPQSRQERPRFRGDSCPPNTEGACRTWIRTISGGSRRASRDLAAEHGKKDIVTLRRVPAGPRVRSRAKQQISPIGMSCRRAVRLASTDPPGAPRHRVAIRRGSTRRAAGGGRRIESSEPRTQNCDRPIRR